MTADPEKLEPIEPRTARELFLQHKEGNCSDSTVRNYKYHLKSFIQWCDDQGIDNLNDISGRDLQQFKLWRESEFDINRMTVKNHMSSLRVFLKWAASIEAVPSELFDKVLIPRVPPEERQRNEKIDKEVAEELIEYLTTYHYASTEHVVIAILWETGIRIGGLHSLDVDDVLIGRQALQIRHQPEHETPLKNGERGERLVAISEELETILRDYIQDKRHDITDEHGRQPLVTTLQGRMSLNTTRRLVYRVTTPCWRGAECPGCVEELEKKCPETVYPPSVLV